MNTKHAMKEAILLYLEEHGPSYMEDIWENVWPGPRDSDGFPKTLGNWPAPLLKLRDAGLVKYDTQAAKWSLTSAGTVEA